MTSRKLTAGGEVVAYCTKCRMDLNHRIVALVDGIPVKVECESCGSHHKYRRPMEERATDKRERKTASSPRERSAPAPRTAGARAAAEAVQETAREKEWQSRIAGKMADEFVKYTPKGSFEADALVHHFKFGDGYVVRVIDANKIEVMFQDGPRVLAQRI